VWILDSRNYLKENQKLKNELLSFLNEKATDLKYLADCHVKKFEEHKKHKF